MKRLLLIAALAGVVGLSACGNSPEPTPRLDDRGVIGTFDCERTRQAKADVDASVGDTRLMDQLGLTEENKDATKTALVEREKVACKDQPASDPNAALTAQAKLVCNNDDNPDNEGGVADCKKRGTTAFEFLKGKNLQGDENVRMSPTNLHKELVGLNDTQNSLTKAVELAGTLAGYEKIAREGGSMDNAAVAAQIHALFPNATRDDVNVGSSGEHPVNWDQNPQEAGTASFSQKVLRTQADIAEFLNGTSGESQAAREHVTRAIKAEGYGDDEVARALNGSGYIPVQIKDTSQILGTTYYKDGKVLALGKWRQAAGGDVYWLFFTKDHKLIRGALLRADCNNPDAQAIMVVRPGMPPAPPVDQPPGEEKCPPGTVLNPETGLCGKTPPPECTEPGGCKPTEVCPPDKPHGTPPVCKDDPTNLPTYGPGPGTNIDPGPGAVVPTTHAPETTRQNPVVTTQPKPAPPPTVQPTVIPTQPTVQPPTQTTNTGVLPGDPGCGNPELC